MHLFSLVDTFLGRSAFWILRLPVQPFLGLARYLAPPPVYLPALWRGWISALEFLVFTRCVVRHLGYFLLLSSRPCPFQKISRGFRSIIEVPFDCFIFPMFSEGGPKWSDELEGSFRATWPWVFVPIFSAVSLLSPGCLVHPNDIFRQRRSWGILLGTLVPCFPSTRVSRFFGETDSQLHVISLGIAFPASWSCRPLTMKVSWRGYLPSLQKGFLFCCRLSSYSVEEEKLR